MTKIFAAFFRLPFESKIFAIVDNGSGISTGVDIEIESNCELIGINIAEYLLSNDFENSQPSAIFDLNAATRAIKGKPRSDYKSGYEPWIGIQAIGKFFRSKDHLAKIRSLESNRFGSYNEWLNSLNQGWEIEVIFAIKIAYTSYVDEMIKENMYETFIRSDMPLLSHFGRSGRSGICIDVDKLDERLKTLDKQYYESVKQLELNYDYFVTGFDSIPKAEEIVNRVPEIDVKGLTSKYFWESVEYQKALSPFLTSLYVEHITRRDKNELLRMRNGIGGTCKVSYDIFGTVSGRILVTRPGIQHLKKNSRGIFRAARGKCFIYGDFAQFEPGILAFLSNDSLLREVYNNGDVYSGLAKIIGSGCERKIAKEIFLSYIYGMKKENIKNKIESSFGLDNANNIDQFFNQFRGVEIWKRNLIKSCRKSLKCQGVSGYTRFFDSNDTDSDLERWAPNHMIQSTASGIFKTALARLIPEIKYGRLLIPMHDAILVEVPQSMMNDAKVKIECAMTSAFEEVCQGVKCRIQFEEFA